MVVVGGSGFVWTSATSSNVPSGYSVSTSYYLTNASTYSGNTSFTSTSGGTETGHSGNGYAKITPVTITGSPSTTSSTKPEQPQYIKEGLILHYDAINNTGNGHSNTTTTWKDLSGNGNDATITGGSWNQSYLTFTQSNEQNGVKTNSNFPIDFNNTFNIVFSLSSVNSVEALLGARTSTTDGMMLFNYSNNQKLTLDTKGSGSRIELGDRLSANKKYNLTVTFSGTTAKLYIDGQITNTVTFTDASLNFPLTIFTAGTRTNSLGDIYSVKVYNRALNDSEVKTNYEVDKERFDEDYISEGLVLHYDGINNTGKGHSSTTTTWKDLSGNNNNGTFSKAPNTSNFYWEENCITLSNSSSTLNSYIDTPINLNNKERTIIYTVDANNLQGTIWGDTDSSNTNGFFNFYTFIANRGNSTGVQNRYDYTFSKSGIYNYAVSISYTEIKFYENGVLKTTLNNTVGLATKNNLRLLAGRYNNQSATNLKMYNFLVYDRVLTDSEIQKVYSVAKKQYNF